MWEIADLMLADNFGLAEAQGAGRGQINAGLGVA